MTLAYTVERMKAVEMKLKDTNTPVTESAHKGREGKKDRKDTVCYHCGEQGHIKFYCDDWLANTEDGRRYAKNHPSPPTKNKSADNAKRSEEVKRPTDEKRSTDRRAEAKKGKKPVPLTKKSWKNRSSARAAQEKLLTTSEEDSGSDEDSEDAGWMAIDDEDGTENFSMTNDWDCDQTTDDWDQTTDDWDQTTEDIITNPEDFCMAVTTYKKPFNNATVSDEWIIDSGASRHMTPMRSIFTKLNPTRISVTIANGEKLRAEGLGEISISIDGQNIRMTDVLYVPGLDGNLLSISALNRKGLSVYFHQHGVDIMQDNAIVATGMSKGKMYVLHTSQTALITRDIDDTMAKGDITPYQTWHTRMGHPSTQRLRDLHNYASGIDKFPANVEDSPCATCNLTKLTRTVSREPFTKSSRRLARIHSDIWGPYRTCSLGGHIYFISLIDDHTRKSWLICLQSRKDLYKFVNEWMKVVELDSGEKVTLFRCDNAKEYQKFEQLVRSEGIQMEYTTPYTPEQNGVAERFNRTIVQMVRSMLTWAELPHTFWGEAAVTANYLRNLLPTSANDKSPEEAWTGHKPNIRHLRTFGCLVYVYIPSENRAKLDRVSFQGIFVGYHSSHQYRVYKPKRRRVEWHTSVKFLEHIPGGRLLRKQSNIYNSTDNTSSGPDDDNNNSDDDDPSTQPDVEQVGGSDSKSTSVQHLKDSETVGAEIENSNSGFRNSAYTPTEASSSTLSTAPSSPTPVRRSTRERKPYDQYGFDKGQMAWKAKMDLALHQHGCQDTFQAPKIHEPLSYKEAIRSKDQRLWKIAILEELQALISNNTWILKRLPEGRRLVSSKWVFRVKYTSSGLVDRYKARLVARGFMQTYGVDYFETFSPTLRFESLRLILFYALALALQIHQMDVPNAYLRSDLEEEIYMEIPEGYELSANVNPKGMALLLQKGLYGLKQAGRNWNAEFKAFLIFIGFVALTADNCVFVDHKRHVIIALYVDDTLIFAKKSSTMSAVKQQLKDKFSAKDLGPASYVLGIRIRRDENRLALDQSNTIRNILEQYNMTDARPVNTPIDGYEALTPAKPDEARTDQLEYQKRMGSIRYLVTCTRPDIAFVASKLSQYTHDPAVRHRVALDRVLRYLKGTMDLALIFNRNGSSIMEPVGYADASFSDDVLDRKSTYGTTIIFGNAACMWVSRKQRSTAGSTMEAEYISLCQATKDIV